MFYIYRWIFGYFGFYLYLVLWVHISRTSAMRSAEAHKKYYHIPKALLKCWCSKLVTFLLMLLCSFKNLLWIKENYICKPYAVLTDLDIHTFASFCNNSFHTFTLRASDGSVNYVFFRRFRYFGFRRSHNAWEFLWSVDMHVVTSVSRPLSSPQNLTFFDPIWYMVYFFVKQ